MRVEPQGYEATKRRFAELKAMFERAREPIADPSPRPTPPLVGGPIPDGFRPLDPVVGGLSLHASAPDPRLLGLVHRAATAAGVDPGLFEALVATESAFDPRAVSPAGAMGLAQLMPSTARGLGVSDPFDPWQNLHGGARYLAEMLREFGGDVRLALAAYNAGPGAVRRHGGVPPFPETRNYVARVLERAGLGGQP